MSENKQQFNNISKEFEADLKKLIAAHGPVINFRLLIGTVTDVPTLQKTFVKKTVWPATASLPNRDNIIDPYTNTPVAIAAIDSYDDKGNPVFLHEYVRSEQEGLFAFRADTVDGQKWVMFLLACNYCKSNKHRSAHVKPAFELVDEISEGVAEMEVFTRKQAALMAVVGMDVEQKRRFAAAMNWDETMAVEVLSPRIAKLADTNPEFFIAFSENGGIDVRATLKEAITKELVHFDPTSNSLTWANGEAFAALDAEEGKNFLDMFAKWVNTHPKGTEIYSLIKSQLSGRAGGAAKKK